MDDKRVKNNEYQPSLSYGRSKKYTYTQMPKKVAMIGNFSNALVGLSD